MPQAAVAVAAAAEAACGWPALRSWAEPKLPVPTASCSPKPLFAMFRVLWRRSLMSHSLLEAEMLLSLRGRLNVSSFPSAALG